MDNITALKTLYVAIGGSADEVANMTLIPELINAIAVKALALYTAANRKELPSVTEADNGKVLKVASGKWAVGTDATA